MTGLAAISLLIVEEFLRKIIIGQISLSHKYIGVSISSLVFS